MKQKSMLMVFVMTCSAGGLLACKQAEHSFASEVENQQASMDPSTPQVPVPGAVIPPPELPIVTEVSADIQASCSEFLMKPPTIDGSATEDRSFTATSGNVVVTEALRNVFVSIGSGSVDIRSAISATIDSGSGDVRINAGHISSAKIVTGKLCIRADHIGTADANGSSGTQVLAAQTIDLIHLGSGAFHVYRATIQKLERLPGGKGGYPGQICLHDGATILDYGVYNPNVATSNCP
jgi:hypothetical protein